MDDILRKGRPLQLDGLASVPIKVTIGFKCEGHEKIKLAHEAYQAAMTLSEYIGYLVSLRHQQQHSAAHTSAVDPTNQLINQLRQQLAFYEQNPIVIKLLALYAGQSFSLSDASGQKRTLMVRQVADVFTVMTNTFKP
jgi:flagellin-specific chaperone FliS